jgi:hypothetical protein
MGLSCIGARWMQVKFQSDSNHHKMRFRHLQELGIAWGEEKKKKAEKKKRRENGAKSGEQPEDSSGALYVGALQLCVPLE